MKYLLILGLLFGTGCTNDAASPRPTKKTTKSTTSSTVTGVVELPDIRSTYVGGNGAFTQKAEEALKYIKISSDKAACMCDEVNYSSTLKAINDLKAILETKDEAYLLIDSPGGSVFDGAMLLSFIEGSKKPIYTVAVGLAASMGAQILEVGHKRYATENAIIMFHPMAGGVRGTLHEMNSLLGFINRLSEKWDKKTAARAGIPYEKFEVMVLKNLWIMPEEALKLNLIDKVVYID